MSVATSARAARARPLVAGNWKMNGVAANLGEVDALKGRIGDAACDVLICPPATLIARLAQATAGSRIAVGAQDCHAKVSGAHTGDIAAEMLRDAGATAVIVGHSERRADHGETDSVVQAKAAAALRAGLTAIVCVGETIEQRKAGRTLEVVLGQMAGSLPTGATASNTVIAYEPVWAIGTGLTPSADDIVAVHAAIRQAISGRLADPALVRLLYGGSVKPTNARELLQLPNVDGALVGGASLKADDFAGIIAAYA